MFVSGSAADKRAKLTEYIDATTLEMVFGGDNDCRFVHAPYWAHESAQHAAYVANERALHNNSTSENSSNNNNNDDDDGDGDHEEENAASAGDAVKKSRRRRKQKK